MLECHGINRVLEAPATTRFFKSPHAEQCMLDAHAEDDAALVEDEHPLHLL
jgi:hypothetical protein